MSEITAPNFNIKTGEIIPPQPAAIPAATISKRTASSIARWLLYRYGVHYLANWSNYGVMVCKDCDGERYEISEPEDYDLIHHYLVKQKKRIRTYLGVTK
jgi:hypothetical protein